MVSVHQHDAQCGWLEAAAGGHRHVVPLADVVDVHRDAGVGADAVPLHQRDQFALRQVVGRRRHPVHQAHLTN